ncbi:MAG: TonB-dependent receptor, partial [Bacteroidales bacterium]
LFAVSFAFAQNITVTGTVTDEATGESIAFAYVQLKGSTSVGTTTNELGAYSINVPSNSTLVFTFIGYTTKEVEVRNRTNVNVVMKSDAVNLDDVIIVAYGTAKKESFTGSAEVIKSDKIEKRTIANVSKALDGMTTGVITSSGSGQPGAGASVVIRGFGSLNASNEPLYVLDGVPYDGNLNAINPNDIESMTIIKDASAGALYGARGANGVIIINTKKGRDGALKVQFKANWSLASRAIPRYETMNSYQWTEDLYSMYFNQGRANGLVGDAPGKYALQEMANGEDEIFGAKEQYNPFSRSISDLIDIKTGKIKEGTTLKWNEDWLDEATANNPLRQEYLLTVSGGSSKTNYMFSMGYLDQDGLVLTTNFRRFSARANIDSQIKEWLKAGLNTNFSNNRTNETSLGSSSGSSSSYSNVFYSCGNMAPIFPFFEKDEKGQTIYDEKGKAKYDWGENRPAGANAGWNPVANLYEDKYLGVTDNLSGRTYVDLGGLKSGPIQGLKLTVNLGFDYVNNKSTTYWNPNFGNAVASRGALYVDNGRNFSYTFNQLLTYNRKFGKHSVDALIGHEFYDSNYQYLYAGKTGVAFEGLYELNGFVTNDGIAGYSNDYSVNSYLSRLNYGYDDKYYVSGSYRRDASSRFNESNRWGNFWSVGASWRISQESFLKNVSWINNITVKASYGVQGNDAIGSLYAWQQLYNLSYPNGGFGGALVSKLETKDLKWEKNKNLNIGIEAKLFNRLSASVEWYRRVTDDMLMSYPIAMSLGFTGYNKNIGSMLNTGVEVSLSGNIIQKEKFNWNMTLMGSTVHNEVLKLTEGGTPIKSNTTIIQEGEPINSFYLAKSAGVDPANGDKLYQVWKENEKTKEKEYYITNSKSVASSCKEVAGSRIPDLYGSIGNDFKIGNFDVNMLFTYSIGGKILDNAYYSYLYNQYAGTAGHVDREKAWKNPGDITSIPRIDISGSTDLIYTADNLINASYFAIKSVTLGYSLPSKWMKAINMQSIRFTVSGDNLYLCSARKGLNPQYNFSGNTGYGYTPERTFSFGIEINF